MKIIKLISVLFCLELAGCGLDETLHRSDKPVSREAASQKIDVPFPFSATNVYYVFYAGGMQEMELFVRFTVDSNELNQAANNILSDHDKKIQEHNSYLSLPISTAPHSTGNLLPGNLSPMTWWNPDSITNGYYRGSTDGVPFSIWVDTAQHTIYFCAHD